MGLVAGIFSAAAALINWRAFLVFGLGFTVLFTLVVFVALATTLVAHPNTAKDITALGNAFSGSLRAARGTAG